MEKTILMACGLITLASVVSTVLMGLKLRKSKIQYILDSNPILSGRWAQYRELAEQGKLPGFKPEDFDLDFDEDD